MMAMMKINGVNARPLPLRARALFVAGGVFHIDGDG
jgi:hypothetical protein